MQQAFDALPSTKFERRKEKQKLPAFLYALWQGLAKYMEAIIQAHDSAVCESPTTLYQSSI